MIIFDEMARSIPCAFCKAEADQDCRTKSGAKSTYTHASRSWPIMQAYSAGYDEAEQYFRQMPTAEAAELIRSYAPAGTELKQCYIAARQKTMGAKTEWDRINEAAFVLGLRR